MEFIEAFLTLRSLGVVIAASIVATIVVSIFGKRWIEARVDSQFAHHLETHKNHLLLITESARFDYSRRLVDLNLFAARRDSAAAALYAATRVAHGYVAGLLREHPLPSTPLDTKSLEATFTEGGMSPENVDELVTGFNRLRDEDLSKRRNEEFVGALQRAEDKIYTARTIAYENELYFSERCIEANDRFLKACTDWIVEIEMYRESRDPTERPNRRNFDEALLQARRALRAEIAQTDMPLVHSAD
jgi:hypothetical protein